VKKGDGFKATLFQVLRARFFFFLQSSIASISGFASCSILLGLKANLKNSEMVLLVVIAINMYTLLHFIYYILLEVYALLCFVATFQARETPSLYSEHSPGIVPPSTTSISLDTGSWGRISCFFPVSSSGG